MEVGLDEYEVRSATGWQRHVTIALWAMALLAVIRATTLPAQSPPKKAHGQSGGLQTVPRAGVGLSLAPTSARACAGWTPAAPEPTRIALLHRSLHTPAASVLRTPRPATPAPPPPQRLSALTTPLTVARAAPGPVTHRAGPPIRTHPPIPA